MGRFFNGLRMLSSGSAARRESDHDLILKISKDIEFIRHKLEEGDGRFDEHTARITSLEESRGRLRGALTTLICIVTVLGAERLIAYVGQ